MYSALMYAHPSGKDISFAITYAHRHICRKVLSLFVRTASLYCRKADIVLIVQALTGYAHIRKLKC